MARYFHIVCVQYVLVCTILAVHLWKVDAEKGIEQRLWESLDRTEAQASYMPSKSMNVSLRIQLISLSSFDPETGNLAIGYYLDQAWKDPTITWDKKKFKVPHITLPADKLWLPDIGPYRAESHEKVFENRVLVFNDGSATNIPYFKTRVTCEEISGGTQRACNIQFGSWTLHGFQLNLTLRGSLDLTEASFTGLEESGWSFVGGNATHNMTYYACCPNPYIHVLLSVTIRRRPMQDEVVERSKKKQKSNPGKCQNRELQEELMTRFDKRRQPKTRTYPEGRMDEYEWEEDEQRC